MSIRSKKTLSGWFAVSFPEVVKRRHLAQTTSRLAAGVADESNILFDLKYVKSTEGFAVGEALSFAIDLAEQLQSASGTVAVRFPQDQGAAQAVENAFALVAAPHGIQQLQDADVHEQVFGDVTAEFFMRPV